MNRVHSGLTPFMPSEPVAPVRVQLSRKKGWRMPENTVKVDRSTRWGNPYAVRQQPGKIWDPIARTWMDRWELRRDGEVRGTIYTSKAEAVGWAVMRHACEVAPLLDLSDLRGKNLACWCPVGSACHADTLLELANEATPDSVGIREADEPKDRATEGGE